MVAQDRDHSGNTCLVQSLWEHRNGRPHVHLDDNLDVRLFDHHVGFPDDPRVELRERVPPYQHPSGLLWIRSHTSRPDIQDLLFFYCDQIDLVDYCMMAYRYE